MPTHHDADADDFFAKRTFSSAKKTAILEKFFKGWASVLQPHSQRLLYIDLYAGPGTYQQDEYGNTGTPDKPIYSTPLRILKAAASDARFAKALVSIFNDGNPEYSSRLETEVGLLPDRPALKYAPQFFRDMVSDDIAKVFAGVTMVPAMLVIDPFGYKGLTRTLISSVLKDWGSDCVFFLNYDRINQAMGQHHFDAHLHSLFGADRTAQMRGVIGTFNDPAAREAYVMENLLGAMVEIGGKYGIFFRFRSNDGRTKHHIVFVSKNPTGYDVMKKAMASESSETDEGVPTYEFVEPGQPTLFAGSLPPRDFPWTIKWLADELKQHYAKTAKQFKEIVQEHNIGRPYVDKNYRAAIIALQNRGALTIAKPDGTAPRSGTCPPDCVVTFKY